MIQVDHYAQSASHLATGPSTGGNQRLPNRPVGGWDRLVAAAMLAAVPAMR